MASEIEPNQSDGAPGSQTVDAMCRQFVEQCGDGVFAVDGDGCITLWNPAMAGFFGVAGVDCVGRVARDVFTSVGVPEIDELLSPLGDGSAAVLRDFTRLDPEDDRIHVYEASCQRMVCTSGLKSWMVAFVRDVTNRIQVEQSLIDSEHEHRLRFMQSADAILVIGRNGRYIDANPAATLVTGYSREEILSMGVPDLSVPEERSAARERFQDLVATGVSRAERVIRRKDGSLLHVEAHAIALGDGRMQTTVRDISERKIAEERLHEAIQKLQFHIERMTFGYIVWTPDLRVSEWNAAAELIFGCSAQDALGRRWESFVPEPDRDRVGKVVGEFISAESSSHSLQQNVCCDGTIIKCEWFNTPLFDSSGKLTAIASMVQDVTERELAESQIRHAQKMESLGVLTRGIAHDFGNLLTVVIGNLRMLRKRAALSDERCLQHMDLVDEAAKKAADLTSHLLAFARTGAHKPEQLDLNDIVTRGMKLLRGSVADNIAIEVSLGESLPKLMVDRSQIEQVVLNLCLNAAEAMPGGGVISLETRMSHLSAEDRTRCVPPDNPKPGPRVELVVRDTGEGMDEITSHRIFEPFYTTKVQGHGLGLAAVLGILKQHEAHVMTRSVVGEGTAFHIYFPLELNERVVEAMKQVEIREDFDATGRPLKR